MSELDAKERASVIAQGLQSAFWQRILLPYLMDRAKQTLRNLVAKTAEDDILRGMYRAYDDMINAPQRELDLYNREASEQATELEAERTDDLRAVYGFRSPYKIAPQPGELKVEEK